MRYTLRPCNRKITALYVGAAAILALMVLSNCALAANGIVLQVTDVSLKQVVNMLTQQSGANIIIADDPKLDKKITANLKDMPLEKILDYVVKTAGVSYSKEVDESGVTYRIGGEAVAESAIVLPDVIPEPVAEVAPKAAPRIWTTIKLVNSRPSELLRLLGWNGENPQPNCDTRYPDPANPHPVKITPGVPGGGISVQNHEGDMVPVGMGVERQNNQPVIPTIDPRAMNSGAGRAADINEGAAQVGPPQPYRPTNPTNPTRPTNTGTNNQNFLWPEGIDNAVPFDLDNSIIVKGDEQGIQDFKNIIRMLDIPPKQVQIKAEFVEVKVGTVKQFGIDWSLDKLNESFSAPLSGGIGNIVVGFATGNLTATLRAQLTEDIGTVINSPIISTINNQNAFISINSQIPYWTTYNTVTGTGTVLQQSTPNFITIATDLNVLPRVNGDGTITMTLSPNVGDTGNVVTGPDGTQIPEQRNETLFTQRRVANGETIVLGGFIRKNDSSSIIKIPILGDLPIVGSLFRGKNKTTEDRELLIFVTPTIIPDVNSGTVGIGGNINP